MIVVLFPAIPEDGIDEPEPEETNPDERISRMMINFKLFLWKASSFFI